MPARSQTGRSGEVVNIADVGLVYRGTFYTPSEQKRFHEGSETIISYITANPKLATLIQGFKLMRDPQKDLLQRKTLENELRPQLGNVRLNVSAREMEPLLDIVYDELLGLGPLGVPWRDDSVTEIMVDSWDLIYVEHQGQLMITDLRFRDPRHAMSISRNLARVVSDRTLSPTNPLVTAQLDGARVNFACFPVVPGVAITLRKFKPLMGMQGLLEHNSLTPEMRDFINDAVIARGTILVSGGTGVGKTTLINALSESIPHTERVITIEDSYELKLANRFVVSMQTKERASRDDDIIIEQVELLRNTLRMRPDRIIVGEIREEKAAEVMLQAANTGHDGTMTTIHANSADAALNNRLANMIRSASGVSDDIAKYQIAEAFDVVVQGTRRGSKRFIEQIAEVDSENYTGDRIKPNLIFRGKLDEHGNVVFERTGRIRRGGHLYEKMQSVGINPERWA